MKKIIIIGLIISLILIIGCNDKNLNPPSCKMILYCDGIKTECEENNNWTSFICDDNNCEINPEANPCSIKWGECVDKFCG